MVEDFSKEEEEYEYECEDCGCEVDEHAKRCPSCGADVEEVVERDQEGSKQVFEDDNLSSEKSQKGYGKRSKLIDNGSCEVLLSIASPEIYRNNAFRTLGLSVDASTTKVNRREKELLLATKYGTHALEAECLFPLNPPPDEYKRKEAVQKLNEPYRRFIEGIFWFWPMKTNGGEAVDPAIEALMVQNIDKANSIWEQNKNLGSKEKTISTHNQAVLAHLLALDIEDAKKKKTIPEELIKKRYQRYWADALSNWSECINDINFKDLLLEHALNVDDPTLTQEAVAQVHETLSAIILCLNLRLALDAHETENRNAFDYQTTIVNQSAFDNNVKQEARDIATKAAFNELKLLCTVARAHAEKDSNDTENILQEFVKQISKSLNIVDIFFERGSQTREVIHDEIAHTILESTLVFARAKENWPKSLILLQEALNLAEGKATQERLRKNMEVTKDSITYTYCWFCGKNIADESASFYLKMYGEVYRDYYANQIHWRTGNIPVPRCMTCRIVHQGTVPSGATNVKRPSAAASFPGIRMMISEGWHVGERPPN